MSGYDSIMSDFADSIKKWFREYGIRQSEVVKARTAHMTPSVRLVQVIILLIIITSQIPRSQAGPGACAACMAAATSFCAPLIVAGGQCFSVAAIPPLLCACLLAAGTGLCVWSVGACVPICLAPTP